MKIGEDVQSAQSVWAMGVKLLGNDAESAQGLHRILAKILSGDTITAFTDLAGAPGVLPAEQVDALFSDAYRRKHGIYFTPALLAFQMAAWLPEGDDVVVDPACGDGALLLAAAGGGHSVWGIESELCSAMAAAIRLAQMGATARIIWGDGLSAANWPHATKAVIGNPPYVGEKGNKALFDAVRLNHPDLGDAFAPRMDLAYLFWWRAIQHTTCVVFLVSEYWLWADSASNLRAFMQQNLPVQWLFRLGQGRFASARGHHSMVVISQPAGGGRLVESDDLLPPSKLAHDQGDAWVINRDGTRRAGESSQGVPLAELAKDQQGFVSGMDHGKSGNGFLMAQTQPNLHLRPVLRASECVANRVFLEGPDTSHVIWIDEALPNHEARLTAWFGDGREKLEARREVKLGRMPWYRLHWPRRRADMTGPKLVVPRRAVAPAFCLDLSGAAISSDCTYLLAPDDVAEPVGYLLRLMALLNSDEVRQQLDDGGKRKGLIFEFYSTPLRRLRLPCTPLNGILKVEASLEARCLACLKMLEKPAGAYMDL